MIEQDVLRILEESGALLDGHFELRSGLHSDRFFQCALAVREPRHCRVLCKALVEKMLDETAGETPDAVIAPALGGVVVGYEVARILDVPFIFPEKQDGNLVLRRFKMDPGDSYFIAEDVITRGGRVQETIEIVEQNGCSVRMVGVLIDRSGGKASFSAPHVSLLEMEPVTYDPAECPMCESGSEAVHPGS